MKLARSTTPAGLTAANNCSRRGQPCTPTIVAKSANAPGPSRSPIPMFPPDPPGRPPPPRPPPPPPPRRSSSFRLAALSELDGGRRWTEVGCRVQYVSDAAPMRCLPVTCIEERGHKEECSEVQAVQEIEELNVWWCSSLDVAFAVNVRHGCRAQVSSVSSSSEWSKFNLSFAPGSLLVLLLHPSHCTRQHFRSLATAHRLSLNPSRSLPPLSALLSSMLAPLCGFLSESDDRQGSRRQSLGVSLSPAEHAKRTGKPVRSLSYLFQLKWQTSKLTRLSLF